MGREVEVYQLRVKLWGIGRYARHITLICGALVVLGICGTPPASAAGYRYARDTPWWVSEVKAGALIHDVGVFGRSEEDTSANINGEILFNLKGRIWQLIWAPRPHIGLTINPSGDTSQAYTGLTWDFNTLGNGFGRWSMGAAVHDGEKQTNTLGKKELGSRVLFRFALEFGLRLTEHHSVSVILDHISNGDLKDENEGIDNFGVRYGYRF